MGRHRKKTAGSDDLPSKVESMKAHAVMKPSKQPRRTFEEELTYLHKISPTEYRVDVGFVPNMRVPAFVIVNDELEKLLLEELKKATDGGAESGGFLPALRQVANVAALPGIVKGSFAMPDVHSGYGFCIGNVAAFDMDDDEAVVSPGGKLSFACLYLLSIQDPNFLAWNGSLRCLMLAACFRKVLGLI
jgi:hypothetical protein